MGIQKKSIDRSLFTDKNVDYLYELNIINTEQMWLLREACDTWRLALRKYNEKLKDVQFVAKNADKLKDNY